MIIEGYLNRLPFKIRHEALKNTKSQTGIRQFDKCAMYLNKCGVYVTFGWGNSPEGYNYWQEIDNKYGRGYTEEV